MWSDRVTEILKKAAQRSALGQRIPESAISSATAGALETEYNRAFSNAASERAIRARQAEQDKALESQERIAREGRISAETIAANNLTLQKQALGLQEQAMEDQSVTNLTNAIVTGGPKAIDYASKAYDWFTTPEAVTSNVPNYEAGAYSALPGTETSLAPSAAASVAETTAPVASPSVLDLGTFATEESPAASIEASSVAMAAESAVASAWQSAAASGATLAHEMIAAEGVGAMIAEQGSLFSMAGEALAAMAPVMPFVGIVFMGVSMIAPEVMAPVNEAIGGVVNTIVDAVSTVVNAVASVFSGGGSIVCEELNRQGYLEDDVLADEGLARLKFIDNDVYEGYLVLFGPVVDAMKKSKLITKIVKPFGIGVAYELASRVNSKHKGSLLGKICLAVGSPICRIVNKVVK